VKANRGEAEHTGLYVQGHSSEAHHARKGSKIDASDQFAKQVALARRGLITTIREADRRD
jgi:hypothetical protein